MAEFALAIERTLAHEGGYVNDVLDPGGKTKFGISQRSYPRENIAELTREAAIEIYHRDFWLPLYDQIISQEIANELFDFGVNAGVRSAGRILQESVRYLIVGPLIPDGAFGPRTLESVNSIEPKILLREFRARQAYYYADIVIAVPDADEQNKRRFLLGWLRRVLA